MSEFFPDVPEPVRFAGTGGDGLGYLVYDPERQVAGKRMRDHLRIAVCYWHSFAWPGSDIFGEGTFDRPWLTAGRDPMDAAFEKQDAAFEFFTKLGTPYYTFHDLDMAPPGHTLRASRRNLDVLVDRAAEKMQETGIELLWGTANLFAHPRYAAGAATNPDPEVFAYAAAQVRAALEATHRLGGQNYVLWGGREGYETLLNTRLRQEGDQLARFLELVAGHKRDLGFAGPLLIEPKPQEPTKHQYDYDTASVHGFLDRYDLLGEFKVNLEGNHATLAGHSFHHEVAYALDHDLFGSIDANRGDPQNGWDTDQFPNSVDELALVLFEILRTGGFETGGFNFDTKLRRQSLDRTDLFHGHIGGIDTLARALLVAEALVEDGALERARQDRYVGWEAPLGDRIRDPGTDLATLADLATEQDFDPAPVSGRQELLEHEVNRVIWHAE
jgi:xylose isomerase